MYTGWIARFPVERPLTKKERNSALLRDRQPSVEPEQRMSLIRINSTYLDWIDRRHLFRGAMPIFLMTMCALLGFFLVATTLHMTMKPAYIGYDGRLQGQLGLGDIVATVLGELSILGIVACIFYFILLIDYFTYTHFPIRFNRKTRMVHVFRHNGEGGVLSVPWDKVFFHIGEGTTRKDLIDIRGEVLDGDIVKATFALGHAVPKNRQRSLLEMWEFIRRYMEEGPEAVGPHPLDRYVELSVTPSWKNCFLVTTNYYAAGLPTFFQVLVSPFVALFILTRWVVLHTCRKPVFPSEIEATCQVDPDDPNVWPIPKSSGEFAATVPGLLAHAKAKALHSWQAEREQRRR